MSHIPKHIRQQLLVLSGGRCEYCLYHQRFAMAQHEFDHIRAEKHGGKTIFGNLCISCLDCNRHKGSDLCGIDPLTDTIATLFNPRQQQWLDHFRLNGAVIEGLTPYGRVTANLLQFNTPERIKERSRLIFLQAYP